MISMDWPYAVRFATSLARLTGNRYRVERDDKSRMPRWRVQIATIATESGSGHSRTVERVEGAQFAGQVERMQGPLGLSWSGSSTTAREQGQRWRNA